MKRIILLELCFLFLATTFQGDRLTGWVQQTIPRQDLPVVDLQFVDSLKGFMVQSRYSPDSSFISKTTDGGNNWTVTQLVNYYLTSLHFVDNNTGYCVGGIINSNDNGIVEKTTDGGNNWFAVSFVGSFIFLEDVTFVNKDTGWVCSTFSFDGGLWRTTDGGINWQMQMNYVPAPKKIFFVNSNTGWFIGSANDDLYKTTNCGANWFLQTHISSLSDVFFISPDTGWAIGGSGIGLMRSINGGNNWHAVNIPAIPFETRLFINNNKLGWGGSLFHKIYATKDGYNWGTQYSPSNRSDNICFVDSLHGWAAYTGLVNTVDGGGIIVGVNPVYNNIPKYYVLEQNYPNPFNPISKIKYKISKSANIRITVFDVTGKEITTLLNENKNPGEYEVTFNGNNLTSGIYFYALFADGIRVETKKMSLIK